MSESKDETRDESKDESKDTSGVGISDDQLPEDLVPSEDNPLAEGLPDGVTVDEPNAERREAASTEDDEADDDADDDADRDADGDADDSSD